MVYIISRFLCFMLLCLWIDIRATIPARITYSAETMAKHKKYCITDMRSKAANLTDSTYQMQRAIATVLGDDADYIPKVAGAGEVFWDDPAVPYQLMHNGVKIILNSYYGVQWLTDVIYGLKGHHEPQEEKCFYEVLKYIPEDATMIELGSYWAYYSLWFSSTINGARNYLIEPDATRLAIGKRNFALNHKTGVFTQGYVGVMIDTEPNMQGAEKIALDDFIERENIEHIHILHADIQGAELAMLYTTVKHLSDIDYFFISTHGNYHVPCMQFLTTHGFTILAEHSTAQSCSGDGLIVAKRDGVVGPERIEIRKY
jgi:hypothetical protein